MILKKFLIFSVFVPDSSYKKNTYKKVSVHRFDPTFLDNADNPSSPNGKVTLC